MMLHDKIAPGQFLLDLKNDCTNSLYNGTQAQSKMDIYGTYNMHHHHSSQQQTQRLSSPPMEGEVLDLSRRCDSVETRKTPSPYNSISSFGTASPSTHCGSPPNPTQLTTPTLAIIPTPVLSNGLLLSQTVAPPLPQGIASLYPFYYANKKKEVESPPSPPAPVIPNPLPAFPHSPVSILQKTLNRSTHLAYTGSQLEAQTCNSPPSHATEPTTNNLYPNILNVATTGTINSSKTTRPFNAYPRDPVLVAAHFDASDKYWEKNTSLGPYSTFRKRALNDLRDTNGGHRTITNPKMRRTNHRNGQTGECEERTVESSDNDSSNGNGSSAEHSNKNDSNNNDCNDSSANGSGGVKDEAYYERRRKNNAAAKKSRDRRRIKEDEIAIRAAYLERQNIELLCQVEALKKQLEIFSKA